MKIHLQGPFDPSRCFEISRFWHSHRALISREDSIFNSTFSGSSVTALLFPPFPLHRERGDKRRRRNTRLLSMKPLTRSRLNSWKFQYANFRAHLQKCWEKFGSFGSKEGGLGEALEKCLNMKCEYESKLKVVRKWCLTYFFFFRGWNFGTS